MNQTLRFFEQCPGRNLIRTSVSTSAANRIEMWLAALRFEWIVIEGTPIGAQSSCHNQTGC